MSSLIRNFKGFLINRVMASAYFPKLLLVAIFYFIMLPRASGDLKAIKGSFFKKIEEHVFRLAESGKNFQEKSKPYVLGLVGLPQTGKTVVANVLMSEAGFIPVNSNFVRNLLVDAHKDYVHIDAIVLSFMTALINSGHNVVMDSDCVSPIKRVFINALAWWCGADTDYLGVIVTPEIWKKRLMSPGHHVHRMYADGVRAANNAAGYQSVEVFPEQVRACVIDEWERQTTMHAKYLESVPMFSVVSNNGTCAELKRKAIQIADLLIL